MSHPFDFGERGEQPFFSISGFLLYPSFHLFWMWLFSMLWCRLTITHFSIFLFSSIFVLFLHFTLPRLIFFLFSSCLMFGVGLVHTHHTCLFDASIHLLSLFVLRTLGPGLMMFSMHCISCMRGMGIISLGYLSLVFFRFFHPITLAYVTSCVLRPPWGHDFTYCAWQLIHGQYLRLVGDYLSGHSRDGEHFSFEHSHPIGFFTLGHTPLISDGFLEVMWSMLGHTPLIDDSFFWDGALHWGIASSPIHLGYDRLGVVGWPYTRA